MGAAQSAAGRWARGVDGIGGIDGVDNAIVKKKFDILFTIAYLHKCYSK